MSYKEFIWFLLSEEDKTTNRRYTLTALHAHTHTYTHTCARAHTLQESSVLYLRQHVSMHLTTSLFLCSTV